MLLRSPLHILVSKNTLIITFIGHKNGKQFSTPVNYVIGGDILYIVSLRTRTWWRNLRDFAPVSVRLQGKDMGASGDVIEDNDSVAEHLMVYLQKVPRYAKYFKVSLDTAGHPDKEDLARAAQDRVMILLRLNENYET